MKGRPLQCKNRHLSNALITSAISRLKDRCHLDLSSQEIASDADTHPSMINYYYSGKDGLFSEILEDVSVKGSKQLKKLESMLQRDDIDHTEIIVRMLFDAYYNQREAISIIVVEALRSKSVIKNNYCESSKKRGWNLFPCLQALIDSLVERGIYRRDLDTEHATWTLIMMVIAPHVIVPLIRANGSDVFIPEMDHWSQDAMTMLKNHFIAK